MVGARLSQDGATQHLAGDWLQTFTDLGALGSRPPGWEQFAHTPRHLFAAERRTNALTARMEREPLVIPDEPAESESPGSMVVAQQIGPTDNEEGKQLGRAWSFLTRPLPLAVGPAPDLLASVLLAEFPWLTEAVEAVMAPVNLSAVNWILAANDTTPLRGPLLTRLRVVKTPLPKPEHFSAVLHSMRRDIAADLKVMPDDLAHLSEGAEARLRNALKRGYSLRRIRSAVEGAIRASGGVRQVGSFTEG